MRGMTVTLTVRTASTPDAFNNPTWTETTVDVPGVLVGQPSTDDIASGISLYGKRIEYMLGIPRGDTHAWEDTKVQFFGRTFRTFGAVEQGIEDNIPGPWTRKVRVCAYE